jgi:hypothetical protein
MKATMRKEKNKNIWSNLDVHPQKRNRQKQGFEFLDNRPEAALQRKIQGNANRFVQMEEPGSLQITQRTPDNDLTGPDKLGKTGLANMAQALFDYGNFKEKGGAGRIVYYKDAELAEAKADIVTCTGIVLPEDFGEFKGTPIVTREPPQILGEGTVTIRTRSSESGVDCTLEIHFNNHKIIEFKWQGAYYGLSNLFG